jgi:hypothetical protein
MSIYTALSFDPPIIAYTSLHQARKGVEPAAYSKTMLELHQLLREQSRSVKLLWEETLSTAIAHTATKIRRSLTAYLTTPLKSDEEDIERALRDELRDFLSTVVHNLPVGMLTSSEGRIIVDGGQPPIPGRVLSRSKSYLRELGFQPHASSPPIFSSQFVIQGGENIDVLEHMVRDRIGIYTPTHGKHIREFEGYSYTLYNLVQLHGSLELSNQRYESALIFSKGETRYEPFRNGIRELIERMVQRHGLSHVSLWQRKLGLGAGREFVLRVRGNNVNALIAAQTDVSFKEKPFVTEALRKGYFLIAEYLS